MALAFSFFGKGRKRGRACGHPWENWTPRFGAELRLAGEGLQERGDFCARHCRMLIRRGARFTEL